MSAAPTLMTAIAEPAQQSRLDRWRERVRVWNNAPPGLGSEYTVRGLAHLAADKSASILGPDWRAFRIGQQVVHWHVPSADWRIWPPPPHPGVAIGHNGIVSLWMLARDLDHADAYSQIIEALWQ